MEDERESRLLGFGVRLGINAAALWLAAEWVGGFEIDGWQSLVATAAIFAVVNALIKPVVDLVGIPATCLTFGLFHLVINAAMLAFTVWIAGQFDFDVELDGFVAAFLAALLISFVSTLLSAFIGRPIRWALR
ncbi:MAG: phage holin family protein [Chloroflexi bacterium]|nr:phage holin family protein [Chloroflexota bacterium]